MEPEIPLLCSEEPATGPYPEADESSSHTATLLLIHFNMILPSRPTLLSNLLISDFLSKIVYAFRICTKCVILYLM
jgi:hypothetical protein